jgi:alkylation response protein AidB-like acyl-CoA dehydrogenase
VHLGPTSTQEDLRSRVRTLFEELSPPAEVRRLMETEAGFDPAAWRRMAGEAGLAGIHLPAALGGGGRGWVELAIVLEEAGRVLSGAPLLSTTVAAGVLVASADDAQVAETLSGIASGRTIATLAVAEATGRWDGAGTGTRAVASAGGRWRLEGAKSYVVDGCAADVLVVAARPDGGDVALFLADAGAAGVSRAPLATVDLTRKQATVTFAAVAARPLQGSAARLLELAAVGLAAEQVGGAQACLDRAVAYARRRVQFGRPIGSFQAVKHLCAEMLVDLESARSAASYAAWAAASPSVDVLPAAAAVAKSCCSEAFVRIATDSLHVHGGLGFTWDDDAHLYFRRARSSAQLFGDPSHHRELLARHLGV